MRTYTVHHAEDDPQSIVELADDAVFVKDGFSWPAFLMPLIWLPYRGMWLAFAGYLSVVGAILLLVSRVEIDGLSVFALGVAVNLLMGFEGNDLLRWKLSREGLRTIAVVQARSLSSAERRFFQGMIEATGSPAGGVELHIETKPARSPVAAQVKAGTVWADQAGDDEEGIVGLFPRPEGKA